MKVLLTFTLSGLLALAPAVAQTVGIAGVQQAASASPLIYETFDYPDGTLIDMQTLPSGNTVWSSNHNAVVQGGRLVNTGNTYPGFANSSTVGGTPQPIKYMWGVFQQDVIGLGYVPTVMIADQDGTMTKFLHLELGSDHWVFSVADGPTYPFETVLAADGYQLLTAHVPHRAGMQIDAVGCKVTLELPDGTTRTVTHPSVCDVNPKFTHYQMGGFSPPGYGSWRAVGAGGPQKADAFVAAGNGASQTDLNKLQSITNKIGGTKSNVPLGIPVLFATFQTAGAQSVNRLRINTITTDNSAILPSASVEVDDRELVINSSGCCNTLGSYTSLHSSNTNGSGVCMTNSVTSSISGSPGYGYTVYLYVQPNTYGGCPNNSYATSARIDYTVEADGDPLGILTSQ